MDTKDIIKKIMDELTPTEYPELYSRSDVEDAIRKAMDMQSGKIKKQELLESNLDEAAEKYELSIGSQDYCYLDIEDAFKAGAEWMAERIDDREKQE